MVSSIIDRNPSLCHCGGQRSINPEYSYSENQLRMLLHHIPPIESVPGVCMRIISHHISAIVPRILGNQMVMVMIILYIIHSLLATSGLKQT